MIGHQSRWHMLNSALWDSPSTDRNNRAIILSWLRQYPFYIISFYFAHFAFEPLYDFLRVSTIRHMIKIESRLSTGAVRRNKNSQIPLHAFSPKTERFLVELIFTSSSIQIHLEVLCSLLKISHNINKIEFQWWRYKGDREGQSTCFLLPSTFQSQDSFTFILVQRRISTSTVVSVRG